MPCVLSFAFDKAGSSMAAKMAMIAMTTRSSISVKADEQRRKSLRVVVIGFFMLTIKGEPSNSATVERPNELSPCGEEHNDRPVPVIRSELIGTVPILKRLCFKCNKKIVVFLEVQNPDEIPSVPSPCHCVVRGAGSRRGKR